MRHKLQYKHTLICSSKLFQNSVKRKRVLISKFIVSLIANMIFSYTYILYFSNLGPFVDD